MGVTATPRHYLAAPLAPSLFGWDILNVAATGSGHVWPVIFAMEASEFKCVARSQRQRDAETAPEPLNVLHDLVCALQLACL